MLLSQAKLAIVLTCGGNQPDALSVCHLHLSREVVSQAVDLVIHLAEKREMAFVGRSHLANNLPIRQAHLLLAPFNSAEIRRRCLRDPKPCACRRERRSDDQTQLAVYAFMLPAQVRHRNAADLIT